MANIATKILQKGYKDKDSKFPRGHFYAELDISDEPRTTHPNSKFKCKKNRGAHVLVEVPPNDEKYPTSKAQETANLFRPHSDDGWRWRPKGAMVSVCSKCNKIVIDWR